MSDNSVILTDDIQRHIYTLRGVQVMLDEELAKLYGVETKVLNQAVKRNIERFPSEFMFQVSETELEILRSQFVTSSWGLWILRSQIVIVIRNPRFLLSQFAIASFHVRLQ